MPQIVRHPVLRGTRRIVFDARSQGFSLTEVLVALVVCGVGLLGLAKMESLALSSTDVAGTRSVAALEAANLAAMMRADRAYWASPSLANVQTTVSGGSTTTAPTITGNAALSQNVPDDSCANLGAKSCSPTQVAALDLTRWGDELSGWLPGYSAQILCSPNATSASTTALTCTIMLQWVENAVAVNSRQTGIAGASAASSASAASTGLQLPQYTLVVEP